MKKFSLSIIGIAALMLAIPMASVPIAIPAIFPFDMTEILRQN